MRTWLLSLSFKAVLFKLALFTVFIATGQSTLFLEQIKKLPAPYRYEFLIDGFRDFYKRDSVKATGELESLMYLTKNDAAFRAAFNVSRAYVNSRQNKWHETFKHEYKAMLIFDSIQNYEQSATSLLRISRYCLSFKREDTLLNVFFGRLKQVEGNALLEMLVLERIGIHFKENYNEEKAIKYLEKAYEISKSIEVNSKVKVRIFLSIYKNLGVLYRNKNEFNKAEYLFTKGIAVAEEFDDMHYKGILLNSLGVSYRERGEYDLAIKALEESTKLKMAGENKAPVATTLSNLGDLYLKTGNLIKAENNFKQAEEILKDVKEYKRKLQVVKGFYKLYELKGDKDKAFYYAKQLLALKDSVNKQELVEENAKLEAIYNADKKQKEIELAELKNKQLESNIQLKNRENKIFLWGTSVLVLLLGWSLFSYFGKRRANKELELKNDLIVSQKIKVEEQHKEIIDSITYAKRLQEGILPSEKLFSDVFKDFFILYKPKDIVAGDFYWMEIKSDTIFVAVADCTGHGVPGALVSMICNNALNRCVYEFNLNDPGKILDKTRELVLESFHKGGMDVKDGMDISLLVIRRKEKEILWAGANNPLWYFGSETIVEIKADKQPIGKSFHYEPFNTHVIPYSPGIKFYLFSDGFADQFGGAKAKKMMQKRFSELISNVNTEAMSAQKSMLDDYFKDWQGDHDQLDDVCVLGIQLN